LDGLDFGLRSARRHGHAAGSNLELDGERADTNERRTGFGSLRKEAVARRAVCEEERLARFDLLSRRNITRRGGRPGDEGVGAAGNEQPNEKERCRGNGMATASALNL
jgi:hypothetical protein